MRSTLRVALPISAAFLATKASAQIVYTNPADLSTTSGTSTIGFNPLTQSVWANSNQTGTGDFMLAFSNNNTNKPQISQHDHQMIATGGDANLDRLAYGTAIDALYGYATGANINTNGDNDAQWAAGTTGYFGFAVVDGADTYYGWAQLTYGSDKTLTIHDFAYESTPGVAIAAGATTSAVPEPSTYAAMAGLLAGSAALLRRRQQRLAQTA